MSGPNDRSLRATIAEWDRAMVGNDPDEIGRYMADDWTIIGTDGSIMGRARFLDLVRSGGLSHDVMESHDVDVRTYGGTAVVIARGVSGGEFQGERFHLVERVSCVFVRTDGEWRCVSTHLSPLSEQRPEIGGGR